MPKAIVLIGDGYEDSELIYPYYRLQEAGFQTHLVGPDAGTVYTGVNGTSFEADKAAKNVSADDYDLLMIPGGRMPDGLRMDEEVVRLVKEAFTNEIVVAAVCHAGQLLAEADVVEGRKVTGWPSVRNELRLAGADVQDGPAIVDGNLITARNPDDLPAFMQETLKVAEERIRAVTPT